MMTWKVIAATTATATATTTAHKLNLIQFPINFSHFVVQFDYTQINNEHDVDRHRSRKTWQKVVYFGCFCVRLDVCVFYFDSTLR